MWSGDVVLLGSFEMRLGALDCGVGAGWSGIGAMTGGVTADATTTLTWPSGAAKAAADATSAASGAPELPAAVPGSGPGCPPETLVTVPMSTCAPMAAGAGATAGSAAAAPIGLLACGAFCSAAVQFMPTADFSFLQGHLHIRRHLTNTVSSQTCNTGMSSAHVARPVSSGTMHKA
jgi:hypothetical protein